MLVDLVQTTTRDGVRLDGAFQPAEGPSGLAVDAFCLVHGTGGNFYSSTLFDDLAARLRSLGCAVLRANTRGHDGISNAATARGGRRLGAAYEVVEDCRPDLAAWVEWLRQRAGPRVGLIGHSLGAVKCLCALAHEPQLDAACAVAISPPRLAYSVFCSSPQARDFLDTYQEAERLVQAGQPTALLDVKLPLPFVITSAGYVEKYGPDERYNFLRFLPAVACPALLTFGSVEVESNMAFRGAPEAIQEIAARRPHLRVETVPGADHFYTAARPDLLTRVEAWLRATLPPSPATPGPARLRPATAADLPAIVAMRDRLNRLELAGCPHASIIPLSLEQFTVFWGQALDDPDYCWRIVEVDGRPVGFGLVYLARPRTQPPTAFLHWAYLEGPQRRQGLGRQLVEELFAWAGGKGVDRVELQFIDGNEPARHFWERMGFRSYARKAVRYLAPRNG